jgi:tRNA G18 (ribose-2'-O)-methylase SpoU
VVPSALINQLVGFKFHRGVLACGRRRSYLQIDDLHWNDADEKTVVVCVDVNDPENMGAILRNIAAFGIDLVVMTTRCADPFSRRVLRTSMGTVFKLPMVMSKSIVDDLRTLRSGQGLSFSATVLDDEAVPLETAARPARFGLLFGNEGHGLSPEVVAECDQKVMIPMRLGTDSLNVSVAAGIFLYHFTRHLGSTCQHRDLPLSSRIP